MTYPTFTADEIAPTGVAFKATIGTLPTPAFSSAAAMLAHLGERGSMGCPVYMSEGDGVVVDKITREELRRLDRAERRGRNRIADALEKAHAGPNGDLLRASEGHDSIGLVEEFGRLAASIGAGELDNVQGAAVNLLYRAQRLDYRLGRCGKRRDALESAVSSTAEQGAVSREDWQNLDGSPVAFGRELAASLEALRNASPGNLASRVAMIVAHAVALHGEALARMSGEREATERAHKLAGDVESYREQRDTEGARAVGAERAAEIAFNHAKRLVGELDGWTVGMLPANAYGAAIVAAMNEAKRELAL